MRELLLLLGWAGAAFAVQTAFAMATFGVTPSVVGVYVLGLAATLPLNARTRGPLAFVVAFGLGWALFVEGISFAMVEETSLSRRVAFAVLLGLPLLVLVLWRFSTSAEDGWFARNRQRVVTVALAVAVPLLLASWVMASRADPSPYRQGQRALGHDPIETLLIEGFRFDRTEHGRRGWTVFQSSWSKVNPEVLAEVNRACERFAATDPWRACGCADELMGSRFRELDLRRRFFLNVALASTLPLGIALLFAWRGRRPRSEPV